MFYVKITASIQSGQTELTIGGEANSFGPTPDVGTIQGTASTTPNPDGKFTLKFQHQLSDYLYDFSGTLSPDLDIINGECVSGDTDNYEGHFLLKKTPTDSIMCHRPLFPRRLDAKESWSFAISAVLGDLRRRTPSRKYVCGRLKMVRRCLELLHNDDRPGEPTELSELRNAFTVQEYTEIRRMALWYGHISDLQPALGCDCCGESIARSRVLCMECDSKDGPASTVEFDAKESCVSCATLMGRDDLRTPHLPSHLLFKTRDMLFLKDYFLLKTRAANGATLGTRLYREAQTATVVTETTTISTTLVLTDAGGASAEPHVEVDASSAVVPDTAAPISTSIDTNLKLLNSSDIGLISPPPTALVSETTMTSTTVVLIDAGGASAIKNVLHVEGNGSVPDAAASDQASPISTTIDVSLNSSGVPTSRDTPPAAIQEVAVESQVTQSADDSHSKIGANLKSVDSSDVGAIFPPPVIPPTEDDLEVMHEPTEEEQVDAQSVNESETTDSDDEETEKEVITLKCLICHERVSTPCWYCLDCRQESEDAFVCRACETAIEELFPWNYLRRYRTEVGYHKETVFDKEAKVYKETLATFSPSAHNILHVLVRIGNTDAELKPADEATNDGHDLQIASPSGDFGLREVEERLLRRMDEDKKQLREQVGIVEQRLARIEAMLLALLPAASAAV
ncbi:hypothetical protein C8R46DRAFT_1353302 [Mycena filopes]|nr:hypothetical protein C8R46DRAFT_1353302 [Mycena filopes]